MSTEKLLNAWLTANEQSRHAYSAWHISCDKRGKRHPLTMQSYVLYRLSRNRTLRLQHAIARRAPKG